MKRIVTCFAFSVALASCGGGEPAADVAQLPAADAVAPATAPVSAPSPAPRSPVTGIDALKQFGLEPDFDYAIGYDIIDKNDAGIPRHRVFIEVLEPDMEAAIERMDQTLLAQGYVKKSESRNDGRVDQVFVKNGVPTMVLLMQTAGTGPKLRNPSAVGSMHLMWNNWGQP